MLNIYARTFMIATLTDAREIRGAGEARDGRRGGKSWLGSAWRRLSTGTA